MQNQIITIILFIYVIDVRASVLPSAFSDNWSISNGRKREPYGNCFAHTHTNSPKYTAHMHLISTHECVYVLDRIRCARVCVHLFCRGWDDGVSFGGESAYRHAPTYLKCMRGTYRIGCSPWKRPQPVEAVARTSFNECTSDLSRLRVCR